MKTVRSITLATTVTLILSGCATIFSEVDYPVTIRSQPSQMVVIVERSNGHVTHKVTTPITITLSAKKDFFKGEDYTIKLMRDNKVVGQTSLYSGVDGWYFANLVHGGLLGMLIIDPLTGAMWELPENVLVTENLNISTQDDPTLRITTFDEVPEEDRDLLVRIDQ